MFENNYENFLKSLVVEVLELQISNRHMVRVKLRLYLQLSGNSTQENIDITQEIIKAQESGYQLFRSSVLSLLEFRGLTMTPHIMELVTLVNEGHVLLDRLIASLTRQRASLAELHASNDALQSYRSHFKEELEVYREFDQLSDTMPGNYIDNIRKELSRNKLGTKVNEKLQALIIAVVILGVLGIIKPDIFKRYLNDIDLLPYTVGGIIVGVVIGGVVMKLPTLIKNLRKKNRKE